MFSALFNFLYEMICGENPDTPEYTDGIFSSVGLLTFFAVLAVAFLFYIALGRFSNIWHTRVHWFITLILASVIGFAVAFLVAKSELGLADGYLIKLAFLNMVFASVYFILFSVILKKFSIYAKRSPF